MMIDKLTNTKHDKGYTKAKINRNGKLLDQQNGKVTSLRTESRGDNIGKL